MTSDDEPSDVLSSGSFSARGTRRKKKPRRFKVRVSETRGSARTSKRKSSRFFSSLVSEFGVCLTVGVLLLVVLVSALLWNRWRQVVALDYPLTALTLQVGQQVSLYPRSLLGTGLRVISTPFLPAGLELDEFSGHISGQALARERPKLWRFRAEAAAHGDLQGRASQPEANLHLAVVTRVFGYPGDLSLAPGEMIHVSPALLRWGSAQDIAKDGDALLAAAVWSVSPRLPRGLALHAGGLVSGTLGASVAAQRATRYTVTATTPHTSYTATLNIGIFDHRSYTPRGSYAPRHLNPVPAPAPEPQMRNGAVLEYEAEVGHFIGLRSVTQGQEYRLHTHAPITLRIAKSSDAGAAVASLVAGHKDSSILALDSFPALPRGLEFDPATGGIRGTPTSPMPPSEFHLQLTVPKLQGSFSANPDAQLRLYGTCVSAWGRPGTTGGLGACLARAGVGRRISAFPGASDPPGPADGAFIENFIKSLSATFAPGCWLAVCDDTAACFLRHDIDVAKR
jgi:hypothetical protein